MKKSLFCLALSVLLFSCGKTAIDSGDYREIKQAVSYRTSLYSNRYADEDWQRENLPRIYHPDYRRESALPAKLIALDKGLMELRGLKIYKEYSRKDLIANDDGSYLVRADFVVVANLDEGELTVLERPLTVSEYYWLAKDKSDGDRFKIIDIYPSTTAFEFVFKDTFIEHAQDFTKDPSMADKLRAIR